MSQEYKAFWEAEYLLLTVLLGGAQDKHRAEFVSPVPIFKDSFWSEDPFLAVSRVSITLDLCEWSQPSA